MPRIWKPFAQFLKGLKIAEISWNITTTIGAAVTKHGRVADHPNFNYSTCGHGIMSLLFGLCFCFISPP